MNDDGSQDRVKALWDKLCLNAKKRPGAPKRPPDQMSPEPTQKLNSKLDIREVEPEMQDEELRLLRLQVETLKKKCCNLYELAPIGYLTLDKAGKILDANLTAAELLAIERSRLVQTCLGSYAIGGGQQQLLLHLRRVSQTGQRASCELTLQTKTGTQFDARLETAPTQHGDDAEAYLTSLIDISHYKQAEVNFLESSVALKREINKREKAEARFKASERQLRDLSARLLAAAEEERKRIAGEIHDSIGSSLGAIKMFLSKALSKAKQGVPNTEDLHKIIAMTRTTACEVRRIVTDLRPAVLDDFGIVVAMRWVCREMQEIYPNLRLTMQLDIEEDCVPEALKIDIFRILQESFHNISKYSKARSVEVSFSTSHNHIELFIADDGVGFDMDSVLHKSAQGGWG